MCSIRIKIKENGWAQGSILDNTKQVISDLPKSLYFVLSHDCNLLCNDLATEPNVELITINQLDQADGTYTKAKNPRKLHIQFTVNNNSNPYELIVANHHKIDRQILKDIKPFGTCREDEVDIVVSWWKDRYARAAFPDAFNNRLNTNKFKKSLDKKLKPFGEDIEAIYIKLNTHEELDDSTNYRMRLMIEVDTGLCQERLSEITQLLEWIVKNIPSSIEIEDDYTCLTAEDITKAELKELQELPLGYLSLD